jgi:glycosyltransferase involved in cell wall biosynthesis
MPRVSVLMSAYNHSKFIKESIESVLNQTYQDFELLIIDDNSTDDTFAIISAFSSSKIWYSKNQQNVGMVLNTNRLITMAKGDYIAIINSDDTWEASKLAKQMQFLEQQNQANLAGCFTLANTINEKSEVISLKKPTFIYQDYNKEQFLAYFFHQQQHHFCYPSVLVKKEVLQQVGLFNPALILLLDFEMWIKILLADFELKILPEKLTNFRVLNNNANLGGAGEKSTIRISLEMRQILLNYTKIADYQSFVRIFTDYTPKQQQKLDLPGYFYLLDYCVEKYFKAKSKNNNIKNFILEFIQWQSFVDNNFYSTWQQNFDVNFADYLKMSVQYPSGNLLVYKKKMSKKLATIAVALLVLLIMVLFFK